MTAVPAFLWQARIWKGGCIIRAQFLDSIRQAYGRNPSLASLLVDPVFAKDLASRQGAWRRIVSLAVTTGVAVPSMSASLAYFDTYRRALPPAARAGGLSMACTAGGDQQHPHSVPWLLLPARRFFIRSLVESLQVNWWLAAWTEA